MTKRKKINEIFTRKIQLNIIYTVVFKVHILFRLNILKYSRKILFNEIKKYAKQPRSTILS